MHFRSKENYLWLVHMNVLHSTKFLQKHTFVWPDEWTLPMKFSGGSPKWILDALLPMSNFLHFHANFGQIIGWRQPSGKSWIRCWNVSKALTSGAARFALDLRCRFTLAEQFEASVSPRLPHIKPDVSQVAAVHLLLSLTLVFVCRSWNVKFLNIANGDFTFSIFSLFIGSLGW